MGCEYIIQRAEKDSKNKKLRQVRKNVKHKKLKPERTTRQEKCDVIISNKNRTFLLVLSFLKFPLGVLFSLVYLSQIF